MSAMLKEETNYWPGYVDALINVLLNLLFLVGIFTVGLVTLNAEVLIAQKKAAELRMNALLEGSTGQARQNKAKALLDAMPKPVQEAQTPQEPTYMLREIRVRRGVPVVSEAAMALPAPVGEHVGEHVGAHVAQAQAAPLGVAAATATAPAQPVKPVPPAPQAPAPQEARNAAVTITTQATPAQERAPAAHASGAVLAKFVFGINEYALGAQTAMPGAIEAGAQSFQLLVEADPGNPRVTREAFARLVAVRDFLAKNGISLSKMQVRIAAPVGSAGAQADAERTVLVIAK